MKRKHKVQLFFVFTVFLVALWFAIPSIPIWDYMFGTLTLDEQQAVPFNLIEFKQGEQNNILIEFKLNKNSEVFIKNTKIKAEDILESVIDTCRKKLAELGLQVFAVSPDYSKGTGLLRITNATSIDEIKTKFINANLYAKLPVWLGYLFPKSKITLGLDLKGGIDLVYQIDMNSLEPNDNPADACKRSVEIIRNRIDMFGIAEPNIKEQEGNRIRIQLPGVKDLDRVKSLIQSTAMLKFHLVLGQALSAEQLEPIDPQNEIVLFEPASRNQTAKWYKLKKSPEITGRDLKYAKVAFDEFGSPIVHLEFTPEGAIKFAQVTGAHIGEQLAIVLDNTVHSAPVIQQKITGGMAQITGRFTLEEAQTLAIVLRAGALPASLILLESRVVGPTLGIDSIRAGIKAGIAGLCLVILYMAGFYKISGIFADIAVIFNTLLIFSTLVFFKGTLTLPGIAGLILSIGMAVDANIIIFERIKEELKAGKTARAAIDAGFDRALSCVIDSNVTTIITVIVLYIFASGPIRGFATTLGIGLLANLFTAVFCVKLFLEIAFARSSSQVISI